MSRYFLRAFAAGVVVQIVLLVLCKFVAGLGDFLLMYVYLPWIRLAITLSGATGEATMIWPPVFGLVGGLLVYSIVAGIAFSLFKTSRRKVT